MGRIAVVLVGSVVHIAGSLVVDHIAVVLGEEAA